MKLVLPRLVISDSVLEFISAVLEATPGDLETGMTLFGTHHEGCNVALHAVGPGVDAIHRSNFHQPDTDYINLEFERLAAGEPALEWIGSLHLHPFGQPELSPTDRRTVCRILTEDATDLPDFVAGIIQRCDDVFAIYPYLVTLADLRPCLIGLEVVDDASPLYQGARERARRSPMLRGAEASACYI